MTERENSEMETPTTAAHSPEKRHPFHAWANLAQPRLGSQVVYASDEFFGAKERLIDHRAPVFIPDKYDDHGKWMDGWESRRKRSPGHDYCIVRLGVPGLIRGVDIDTSHFTGNYPPHASIDACYSHDDMPPEGTQWQEMLARVALQGNSHHYLPIEREGPFSHLRLNIYPDGGIARLRVFGQVRPDWPQMDPDAIVDLIALENGGRALACNDEHFGSMQNLNVPGRGVNMGDGWETARRRVPGNDWVVLALGHAGTVEKILIDTAHFKGNYPDRAAIQAALVTDPDITIDDLVEQSEEWAMLLPQVKLEADREHLFIDEIANRGPITHIRLNIFPDGGVSRLRLFGRLARDVAST